MLPPESTVTLDACQYGREPAAQVVLAQPGGEVHGLRRPLR